MMSHTWNLYMNICTIFSYKLYEITHVCFFKYLYAIGDEDGLLLPILEVYHRLAILAEP